MAELSEYVSDDLSTTSVDLPANNTKGNGAALRSATGVFAFACIATIILGVLIREEYYLSAESGIGYALGICGGVMMLLLLIYPLRKRFRIMGHLMTLQQWFRIHMLLGIVGPLCILFHCNFSFGSTNSNVALISMILMVFSGLVGRYIYSRIHMGLYGERASLQILDTQRLVAEKLLEADHRSSAYYVAPELSARLSDIQQSTRETTGVLGKLWMIMALGMRTRLAYISMAHQVSRPDGVKFALDTSLNETQKRQVRREIRQHIALYLSTIRKIAQLGFYERLFSLWHTLHLPIFFMLVATGLIHVYAVHYY